MPDVPPSPAPPASPAPTAPPPAARGRRWPWIVCVVLMFATLISYLDRQSFSVVGPVIRDELALDNAGLGSVLSAFYLAYGIMHLFVGWFLDRFDTRRTYAAFVALWSLAQMATGLVRGFAPLYTCRFALGIFEAAGQTGAARIISRIIPQGDRTLANGIMMSGSSLGAIVAPIVMVFLNQTVGWRTGFIILGAVGLAWVIFWLLWFRPPPGLLAGHAQPGHRTPPEPWGVILRDRRFWACAFGAAFTIPIIHVSGAWLPTYFVQTWNLKLSTDLALYLTYIYLAADVSLIGTGLIVSRLTRRGCPVGRARKYVLVAAGLLMVSVGAVFRAPTVPVAVTLVLLLNMGRAAFGAIFLSFNQEIAHGRVATIAGLMGAIGAFSGSAIVYLVGLLTKQGGFGVPFVIIAVFGLIGTLALLLTDWDSATKHPAPQLRAGS
jgi:ACS family hexuronate transporter-like MFS transporter